MYYGVKIVALVGFFLVSTMLAGEFELASMRSILERKGEKLQQLCRERGCNSFIVEEVKKLFLDREFDYNNYVREYCTGKESPLHNVVKNNNKALVTQLIAHASKEALNVRNVFGWSPLHEAVAGKNCAMVATLLEANADVHVLSNGNHSPLLRAVIDNNREVVSLLVEHGSNGEDIDFILFAYFCASKRIQPSAIIFLQKCLSKKGNLRFDRSLYTTGSGDAMDKFLYANYEDLYS